MLIRHLHHQLRPQRHPAQILPRVPPALAPRHPRLSASTPAHPAHGCPSSAPSRYGARNSTSSFRFAAVKLAHTPTCCSAPASLNSPSSSDPTSVPSPVLCHRNPATTQSQSRSCFTFSITRLSGWYVTLSRLRHHPIQPRTLKSLEPVRRHRPVPCRRRHMHRCLHPRQNPLQPLPPLLKTHPRQVLLPHRTADRKTPPKPASAPPAASPAKPPDAPAAAAHRSPAHRPAQSQSPRRARTAPAARASTTSITSGKYRFSDFPSRLCSSISSPSRNTTARNPSHFGSNIHSPTGKPSVRFASIGRTGGFTGNCTPKVIPPPTRPDSPRCTLAVAVARPFLACHPSPKAEDLLLHSQTPTFHPRTRNYVVIPRRRRRIRFSPTNPAPMAQPPPGTRYT